MKLRKNFRTRNKFQKTFFEGHKENFKSIQTKKLEKFPSTQKNYFRIFINTENFQKI